MSHLRSQSDHTLCKYTHKSRNIGTYMIQKTTSIPKQYLKQYLRRLRDTIIPNDIEAIS